MFDFLRGLRIVVGEMIAAFMDPSIAARASREYKRKAERANRETAFFNEHWQEIQEAERFIAACERMRGDQFPGFISPNPKGK
jgi:hypothetical protein